MELSIIEVSLGNVDPNPWNPNKQTTRQYEAEIESILSNGFVMPIIVRQQGERFQIIDGEHRYRALTQIGKDGSSGVGNVDDLVAREVIPAILLDVPEPQAKRLTVILNETRGRADMALLGELLSELQSDFAEDLIVGLPYTPAHLAELINIGDFDWSSLEIDEDFDEDDLESLDPSMFKVAAALDAQGEVLWKAAMQARKGSLPEDRKEAAGALIKQLLQEVTNDDSD